MGTPTPCILPSHHDFTKTELLQNITARYSVILFLWQNSLHEVDIKQTFIPWWWTSLECFVGIIYDDSIISLINSFNSSIVLQPHDTVERKIILKLYLQLGRVWFDRLDWVPDHPGKSAGWGIVTLDFEAWCKLSASHWAPAVSSCLKWTWYITFLPTLKDSCEQYLPILCGNSHPHLP